MKTFYSYFRGGGGAEIGAELAGYTSIGGVEFDVNIAAVCDVNFPQSPTTVADVCAVDPAALLSVSPSWFHASPSCRNASQAKADAGEAQEDRDAGQAVAQFIRQWTPPVVTIENVWQYRTFDAFGVILQSLRDCGYSFDYWHLNAADYGVPQTRKRLILVAKRGEWNIQRPEPTHRSGGDMFVPAWNGWYSAIADLVPTLPESKFAAWQLARLPEEMTISVLAHPNSDWFPAPKAHQPAFTVATFRGGIPRAFIVDGTANDHGRAVTVRNSDEPMMTVSANGDKRKMRAFLADHANNNPLRTESEPAHSITAQADSRTRAWLDHGRTVAMTPRALARFQSFPDSYLLPERNAVSCKVIGNAVPPLLMQWIGESL